MIAVDAGTHLASITRILQQHMPLYSKEMPPPGYTQVLENGPFAGLKFNSFSARANALQIFRELMQAFLITHPHLDHLSAMAINTPALEYGRDAKTIVALGSTIEAIKTHIFNDWIWPNLSDENGGVGFVTYRRLQEGGHQRLGSGDQRGYVRIADGLMTMCLPVTHGKCKPRPALGSRDRHDSDGWHDSFMQRRLSRISDHAGYFANANSPFSMPYGSHLVPGQMTPGGYGHAHAHALHSPGGHDMDHHMFEPVKSAAFFILNEETCNEILIFGDTEPDSVSITPLNYKVWRTAASKIANGSLKAVFIECSYDDTVRDADLYGHLCPRHLIEELTFLGREVAEHRTRLATVALGSSDPGEQAQTANVNGEHRKRKESIAVTTATVQPVNSTDTNTRSSKRRKSSQKLERLDKLGEPAQIGSHPQRRQSHSTSHSNSHSHGHAHSRHVRFSGPDAGQLTITSHTPSRAPPHAILSPVSPFTSTTHIPTNSNPTTSHHEHNNSDGSDGSADEKDLSSPTILDNPLAGLTIHIIHVKDTMADGPGPGEIILEQLTRRAGEVRLGCEFRITAFGDSIWV